MTKSELVKKLMEVHDNLYLKDVRLLVDTIFNEMSDALQRGDRIELRGFGAFSIRKRKPRVARNPKTNEKVELGERSVVYFRAGKGLRDRLNDNAAPAAAPSTSDSSFSSPEPTPIGGDSSSSDEDGGDDNGGSNNPFSNPY